MADPTSAPCAVKGQAPLASSDECALTTHQVDEVCGDGAIGDADGNALRGTDIFSRVLHPQEVHPCTCTRKSGTALTDVRLSSRDGLTTGIATELVALQESMT